MWVRLGMGIGRCWQLLNELKMSERYWATPQVPLKYPSSTPQVDKLLLAFGVDYLSIIEIMALMGLKDRKSFREKYLNPAIEKGLLRSYIQGRHVIRNKDIACRQWVWVIEAP